MNYYNCDLDSLQIQKQRLFFLFFPHSLSIFCLVEYSTLHTVALIQNCWATFKIVNFQLCLTGEKKHFLSLLVLKAA